MKNIFIIFISLLSFTAEAKLTYGFKDVKKVCEDSQIYQDRKIRIDHDNNKYVLGYFKGTITLDTFTISTLPSITNSPNDFAKGIFLIKYNENNNVIWLKKMAEADTMFDALVSIDYSNNLIISYAFLSTLYIDNDTLKTIEGRTNVNLYKYNSSGTKINEMTVKGLAGIGISKSTFDSNNNLYVGLGCGSADSITYSYMFGIDTFLSKRGDIILSKLDSNFNIIWSKKFGSSYPENFKGVYFYSNSLYIVVDCNQSGPDLLIGGVNITFPNNYTSRIALVKMDLQGNTKWVKRFGNNDNSSIGSLFVPEIKISKDRIYLSGHSFSNTANTFLFEGGPTLTFQGGQTDYFLAAYDTNGNFKWNTMSQTYQSELITQLEADSAGNVIAVGLFDAQLKFPTDTISSNGGDDIFVCSYSKNGNFLWATSGGGTNADTGDGIAIDNNNKIWVVGGTASSNGCYLGDSVIYPDFGKSNLFFASVDSIVEPASTQNISALQHEFIISPNPAQEQINIQLGNLPKGNLIIQNAIGQMMYQTKTDSKSVNISIAQFSNGIYFVKYQCNQMSFTKKLIVQH